MQGCLDKNCKAKLLQDTVDALEGIEVTNAGYITPASMIHLWFAGKSLPDHGPLRLRLNSYVSEHPYFDFVRDSLSRLLRQKLPYSSDDTPIKLGELPGFGDTNALATHLVDQFDGLPWACEMHLPLPDPLGAEFLAALGPSQFSDRIFLVALDEGHKAQFPLSTGSDRMDREIGVSSLLNFGPPAWPSGAAALKVRFNGYINQHSLSDVVQDALGYVDSFFGICVALRLLKPNGARPQPYATTSAYFHKFQDSSWHCLRRYELDLPRSQNLLQLDLSEPVRNADQATRTGNFIWVAARIREVFRDHVAARQVISASQWLLNSYSAGNAMLAFVQATVALEILLGDEKANDGIGLTELLRNRCAYLVADNQEERGQIKKKFTEIYAVRSKIVHAGKNRLTFKESMLLSELQLLGHRVIAKEIEMLPKPKEPNAP